MKKIGVIGTGVMGTGLVKNLIKAGFTVTVYNRTKAHAQRALQLGATWSDSPAVVTQLSEVVITMVGFPKDVEEIYFGEKGILSVAKPGQILIDMTTSRPSLARKVATTAAEKNVIAIDAPVSGGDIGADKGILTIMVGGDRTAYQQIQPILNALGTQVNLFGGPGQGQAAKMANQIMIAGTMTGLTEMLVYARKSGLNLDKILQTVGGGAAGNWSLSNYGPRILKGDYSAGFFAKHFLKDLRIALDEAKAEGLNLPATQQAEQLYQQLVEQRQLGNEGTQALVKLWWDK